MATPKEVLRKEFEEPEARADYADIFLNSSIALQIKILRQQRQWTQEELAQKADLHQSQISSMEQASHRAWKVSTLRRLARAFDLALVVRFESFGVFLDDVTSASRGALERVSFPDDPAFKPQIEDSSHSTPILRVETGHSETTTGLSRQALHETSISAHRYTKEEMPLAIPPIASGNLPYLRYIDARRLNA